LFQGGLRRPAASNIPLIVSDLMSNPSHDSPLPAGNLMRKAGKQADQLLWDHFRQGCESTYGLIYKTYFFSLYSYGLKICPDKETVKDAIQDLFVHLWKNKEKLGATDSIKRYLFTGLKWRLLDNFSAQSKFCQIAEINEVESLGSVLSEENMLILEQFEREQSQQVQRALEKLTNRQQQAVVLKFYENMPAKGIANIMGISVEGVYNLIHKSIRQVRKDFIKATY
jgi:RNA polymerase sigma factor (sigma-70 family)